MAKTRTTPNASQSKPAVYQRVAPSAEREKEFNAKKSDAAVNMSLQGNQFFLKPDFKDRVNLIYLNSQKGPSVVRPLPYLNPADTTKFLNYRTSDREGYLERWIYRSLAAESVGTGPQSNRYSWFLAEMGADGEKLKENPYVVLYNNIHRAVRDMKKGAGDLIYMTNTAAASKDDRAPLSKPKAASYVQGLLLFHNGNLMTTRQKHGTLVGLKDDDKVPLIKLNSSAAEEINYLFAGEKTPQEIRDQDPLRLDGGKFLIIGDPQFAGLFDEELDGNYASGKSPNDGWSRTQVVPMNQIKVKEQVFSPKLAEHENHIRKIVMFWSEVVDVPSIDEQCLLCAKAFAAEFAHAFEVAWVDHKRFFTAEVKAVLAKAKTVLSAGIPDDDTEEAPGESDWTEGAKGYTTTEEEREGFTEEVAEEVEEESDVALAVGDTVVFQFKGDKLEGEVLEIDEGEGKVKIRTADKTVRVKAESILEIVGDEPEEEIEEEVEEEIEEEYEGADESTSQSKTAAPEEVEEVDEPARVGDRVEFEDSSGGVHDGVVKELKTDFDENGDEVLSYLILKKGARKATWVLDSQVRTIFESDVVEEEDEVTSEVEEEEIEEEIEEEEDLSASRDLDKEMEESMAAARRRASTEKARDTVSKTSKPAKPVSRRK